MSQTLVIAIIILCTLVLGIWLISVNILNDKLKLKLDLIETELKYTMMKNESLTDQLNLVRKERDKHRKQLDIIKHEILGVNES